MSAAPCASVSMDCGEPVAEGDKIISVLKIIRRGEIECKQPCRLFLPVPCAPACPCPPGAGAVLRVAVGEAVAVVDNSSRISTVNCKQRDVCECIHNER